MGWRDEKSGYVSETRGGAALERVARDYDSDADLGDGDWLLARLMEEPPADRIALARELLEGTGKVVAEPIDRRHTTTPVDGYNAGWNACRAAMLGDEG